MSAEPPAEGDTCSLCAQIIEAAGEHIEKSNGEVPAGLAEELFDNSPEPAIGGTFAEASARIGACIEIAIARTKPTKKDRPKREKKANACPDRKGDGHCPTHGATCPAAPPAQAPLPGLGAARTLPTPPPVAQLPAESRGTCSACREQLTRENSSRLPSGRVVHVGCAAASAEVPIELSSPCAACDAERGEPCAWATAEPASHVHPQRVRLLSAEEQREIASRATADRIRALCDHYAGLASVHPMPTRGAIMRAVTSDGTLETLAADVFGALCERGELVAHREDEDAYYRRAPGSPPVVMGRTGVKVATKAEPLDRVLAEMTIANIEEDARGARLSDFAGPGAVPDLLGRPRDPRGAGMREAEGIVEYAQRIDEEATAAAMLDAMGPPVSDDGKGCNLCGGEPGYVACLRCGRPGTLPLDDDRPSYGLDDGADELEADDRPLSPVESVLAGVREAESILARVSETARKLLGAEVRERAAVEQLDAVQRERDGMEASAAKEEQRAIAAETAIRDLAEALGVTLGASPAETCVEIAKKTAADVALAKDLARLAQVETADRLEEKRTLRAALANLYERCGGTDVPADDADLISATADRVMLAIGPEVPVSIVREGAAERAIAELAELFNVESEDLAERIRVVQLRAESERSALRVLEKSKSEALADLERWTGRARAAEDDASGANVRAGTMAARVIALRAGIVGALAEPPAEPAEVDDAALVALLRSDRAPELDGAVAAAVLDLTGETPPMGQGVAPLAEALGDAVRGVLAERSEASRRAFAAAAVAAHVPPVVPTPTEPASPPARRARTFE
jgi:hypothetical protein